MLSANVLRQTGKAFALSFAIWVDVQGCHEDRVAARVTESLSRIAATKYWHRRSSGSLCFEGPTPLAQICANGEMAEFCVSAKELSSARRAIELSQHSDSVEPSQSASGPLGLWPRLLTMPRWFWLRDGPRAPSRGQGRGGEERRCSSAEEAYPRSTQPPHQAR